MAVAAGDRLPFPLAAHGPKGFTMIATAEQTTVDPATMTDLELAGLPYDGLSVREDWPDLQKQYDAAILASYWLIDVMNVNGRSVEVNAPMEPRHIWVSHNNARELAATGNAICMELELRGLVLKPGDPIPSKTDIMKFFHAEVTDALVRVIAEEAREKALGITYDDEGNPYGADGKPLYGDDDDDGETADEPEDAEAVAA